MKKEFDNSVMNRDFQRDMKRLRKISLEASEIMKSTKRTFNK